MSEPTVGEFAEVLKLHKVIVAGGMRFEWIGEVQIGADGTWSVVSDA